ncbi:phage tail sheath subtilisin-like domain-containing protein [Salibacterium aidingense]|uniref:phage tail sheath subtilisin-like domain-containing protein n=1 Tax=Salibacterium aidingense TaxID=384933 RepID=UPI003BEDD6E1
MAWEVGSLTQVPGVYTNFEDNAPALLQRGPRGIVAIPLTTFDGDAEAEKVYEVTRPSEAVDLFGESNTESIDFAFEGGANKVIVYTLPDTAESADYDAMIDKLEGKTFNVIVLDQEADETNQDVVLQAVKDWREEDKHVSAIFGGDDSDLSTGNDRSSTLEDAYSINVINGIEDGETTLTSAELAPYIAGVVASIPLNETATYKQTPGDDVTLRLRKSDRETAIEAGSLYLINDGDNVKIGKGITTSGDFIRSINVRQSILNDLPRILQSNVVAQLDNTPDGRTAAISMMKRHLEDNYVSIGAISDGQGDEDEEMDVYVDPENEPTQDAAFFVVEYTDVYSMERVFLTVKRQG